LTLTDMNAIAAQIYAPHMSLAIENLSVPLFGSLFASRIETQSIFTMHFDRSIIEAGEDCPRANATPATLLSAGSCRICPDGLATTGRTCASCTSDADCCEPFLCADGACQPANLPR
jgi:hypothetical protein